MRDPGSEVRYAWVLRNGAHLVALSAFALAQPIFDILGRNPEFFAVRGSTATEIVVFALVVVLALPLALLAIEVVANLLSHTARRAIHLLFVGLLAAVIVLHVVVKNGWLTGEAALLACTAAGAASALLYWRASVVRAFLSILALAPIAFLVLFLVSSPVSRLVFTETAAAEMVAVKARTPVVLIVFDEFSSAALMGEGGRVDPRRWPNFASLAADSTWFRNATTVHAHTNHAVPAILDGKLPVPGRLPILADHPQNLFTLLGGSYELKVVESQTHLCPPKLCRTSGAQRFDPGAADRTGSLASDVGIVYLHLLLPDPYAADLPPISNTWGNFGGREETGQETTQSTGKPTSSVPACSRGICRLASLIDADRKPTLYFLHSLLPHVPWLYLPSGKHYGGDVRVIPGAESGVWQEDGWLTTQARQRYLLQTGYTDRALGIILRRLKATGLYDRALVIVTADHGETFQLGSPRRTVTRANLADIAFVPLFVKTPGQKRGRIDDSHATSVDILPTIADVLRAPVPWNVEGKSLLRGKRPTEAIVQLTDAGGRLVQAPLSKLLADRSRDLAQFHALFGTGSQDRIYRIGPHRELLGKHVGTLNISAGGRSRVELDGSEILRVVDLTTSLLPSYVTGGITPSLAETEALAIALNGRIRATTRSYTRNGKTRFAAFVPESALRSGANDVTVFAIHQGREAVTLTELAKREMTYVLADDAATIETSGGPRIRVGPSALKGQLKVIRRTEDVTFRGWAADLAARRPAESVVVFVDGRSVFIGHLGNIDRDDITERYGVEGAGFTFRFPSSLLPQPREGGSVRLFAVRGSVASELPYPTGYPWATR